MARFLVVDCELNAMSALRELLESDGHEVAAFTNAREAFAALRGSAFDAVLTDVEALHTRGDAVVRLTREYHPAACVFLSTARGASRGLGEACHVFEKPIDYERVTRVVAACQAEGGPGRQGGCYMKSRSTRSKS